MNIRVSYCTEAFLHKNGGLAGTSLERWFDSLEEAKNAPLPEGYVSAYVPVPTGHYVYSTAFGWEFYAAEGAPPTD